MMEKSQNREMFIALFHCDKNQQKFIAVVTAHMIIAKKA